MGNFSAKIRDTIIEVVELTEKVKPIATEIK